jgi:hypothetical protein
MIERMATRTTTAVPAPFWDPASSADADQQREDALRSRIRRLLASGALHRHPWRLSTHLRPVAGGPEPCVVCFDAADTTYEEPASKFTVAAHAEPCGRLWIEEALEAHE